MPAGRPTDYNEEVINKTREYLDSCVDEEYQLLKSDGAQSTSYENRLRVKLPSIEGLAVHLKVRRSTIYEWQKKYEEFSDIIEELLSIQAEKLLNNGISGSYNPTIAKVILTKHGYIDRKELTGKDGEQLIPTPIYGGTSVKK